MRRFALIALGATVALIATKTVHTQLDPWWRPLNPFGQSYGVTVGNTRPTDPRPGEIFIDMNGASDGGPRMEIYDGVNATFDEVTTGASFSLVDNHTFTGLNIFNRSTAGVDSCFGGAEGDANAICIDGDTGQIIFEGAVADANESFIEDLAGAVYITTDTAGPELRVGLSTEFRFDADTGVVTCAGLSVLGCGFSNGGAAAILFGVPSAGTGGLIYRFPDANLTAMDGSDEVIVAIIDLTNANHTGAGNFLIGLRADDIVGDVDATEIAFDADTGWDISYRAANRRVDLVQAVTCVDNAGTGGVLGGVTITPTSSYIEVTNNDAQGCEVLFNETGAFEGQIFDLVIVVDAGTDTSTIPDSAGIFNGTEATTLDANDSIRVRYTGGLFVQVSLSNN